MKYPILKRADSKVIIIGLEVKKALIS